MCLKNDKILKWHITYIAIIIFLLFILFFICPNKKKSEVKMENRNIITTRHTVDRPDGTKETFETITDKSTIKNEVSYKTKSRFISIIYNPFKQDYYVGGGIILFDTVGLSCHTNHNIDFLVMAQFYF